MRIMLCSIPGVSPASKKKNYRPCVSNQQQQQQQHKISLGHGLRNLSFQVAAALLGTHLLVHPPVFAADALKTCTCLLKECRLELARCIADPSCAANVACLQTCNDRPDETECQIKCGDLFENKVVDAFNDCAVSKKRCVPQKRDEGQYPVPQPSAIVDNFNTTDFTGKWYISSGLNPSFDTFDCQVHQFSAAPQNLTGNLSWRISTPDGGFITRTAVQKFVQDPNHPGILYNHDNPFLHYQDDWYILASKIKNESDDFVFVYYRGSNDAWDGYGGAVVYTRSPKLPENILPQLKAAASKAGLDFNKFKKTDNTCGEEPPLLARIEKKVENVIEELKKDEEYVVNEFKKDEEYVIKELSEEEKSLLSTLQMKAQDVEQLFGKALPVRKLR